MASILYEIVMLSDGEFALQRSDERGEPLVRIQFSEEATHYLRGASIDVARAMIDAGIDAVEQMNTEEKDDSESFEKDDVDANRILH